MAIYNDHKFLTIDDSTLREILKRQNIPQKDLIISILKETSEVYFINKLIFFICNNDFTRISEEWDLFLESNRHKLAIEIYVAILYHYYSIYNLSNNILTNKLENLYLVLSVDSMYNQDKYMRHFKDCELNYNDISYPLDFSIREYIHNGVKELKSPLDIIITIYLLLCNILKYDVIYTLKHDPRDVLKYSDVTLENNSVVCFTFSLIYQKLLEEYGINASLAGSDDTHMYVTIQMGNFMIKADSSRWGNIGSSYNYLMSDLNNVKCNCMIQGLYVLENYYSNPRYGNFYSNILGKAIRSNASRLGLDFSGEKRAKEYIKDIKKEYSLEHYHQGCYPLDMKQCNVLNKFDELFNFLDDIAKMQLFKKYFNDLFYRNSSSLDLVFLYDLSKNSIVRMISIRRTNWYYLDINGKFMLYDKKEVLNILKNNHLVFKNNYDIDILHMSLIEREEFVRTMKQSLSLKLSS